MNKALKYLDLASLLSDSVKTGSKVFIMSGLKEHEFNLEIVKNDPFIQHMLLDKKSPTNVFEISRDSLEQASWGLNEVKKA